MIAETSFDRNFIFFFNDTATTEIYTLSLHDALPICLWKFISGVPSTNLAQLNPKTFPLGLKCTTCGENLSLRVPFMLYGDTCSKLYKQGNVSLGRYLSCGLYATT